jgi:hypothetical protein
MFTNSSNTFLNLKEWVITMSTKRAVYIVEQSRQCVMKLPILRPTIKNLLLQGKRTKENCVTDTNGFDKDVLCRTARGFYDRGKYATATKLRLIKEAKI